MKLTKRHLISLIKEALLETQYTSKGHWGKKASGVLLTTGEHILLLLRSKEVTEGGTWGIPGGAIDRRETAEQAAKRELWEETGLRLQDYNIIGNTIFKDEDDGFTYTTFIIKVPKEYMDMEINLNSDGYQENDAYEWVDQDWLEDNAQNLHSGVMYTLEQKWNVIFDSDYL